MANLNKVQIIGALGRDPELRYTQGGQAVCKLNVATSRKWTNKQTNEHVEETEWHRVVIWGRQAEICEKILAKGRKVYVEGRLKTSSYDDKDGKKCYSTEIIAEQVQFLSPANDGKGQAHSNAQGQDESPSTDDHANYVQSGPDDADDLLPF